jgi:hypothetical protein
MKKIYSLQILPIITGLLIILTGSAFMGYYPGGSPGGYSGSPLDGKNCTYCHNGTATTQAGILTSDIDTSGYVPGSNYTITVSIPGSGLKGFEVSPLNSANQKTGTLTAGTNSKLTNSAKSVTHSVTSNSNPGVWSFQFTAPASGTGNVTFYGAFAAGKSKTLLSTMVVKEKKIVSISSDIAPKIKVWYESGNRKLCFKTTTANPQTFSANIYSINGKNVLQIADKKLANGLNYWEADVAGLKTPGIFLLNYFIGNSSSSIKMFLY